VPRALIENIAVDEVDCLAIILRIWCFIVGELVFG